MNKVPCLVGGQSSYALLQDYGNNSKLGWVVLVVTDKEYFTKADTRIKGDIKMATNIFEKLYGYGSTLKLLTLTELSNSYSKKDIEKAFIAGGKSGRDINSDGFDEFMAKLI